MTKIRKAGSKTVARASAEAKRIEETHGFNRALREQQKRDSGAEKKTRRKNVRKKASTRKPESTARAKSGKGDKS